MAELTSDRSRGRGYLWLGIGLCVLGVALAVLQFRLKVLLVPWFSPILSTIGTLLLLGAVIQRVGVLRIALCMLVAVFAGLQWIVLVWLVKLPAYEGPHAGVKLPVFRTTLASGGAFEEKDLEDGQPSVLLFFRGRW